MAASMSTLEGILKEAYLGVITSQLNNEITLWQRFSKGEATMDATGKYGIMPVKLGRNTGVGARGAAGTLPTAGNQVLDKLVINYKFVYGSFGFDGPALAAAKKGTGAFATVADVEMTGLKDDVLKYANMVGFLGGQYIGLVIEKSNQVAHDYSGRWKDITVGGGETVSFVRLDTFAVIGTQALSAISATEITTGVAIDTSAITPGVPVAVKIHCLNAANAFIANEPTGMLGNLVQVDHFGLSRAVGANATLISNYRTMAGGDVYAALDLDDMQLAMDTIEDISGKSVDFIDMNTIQRGSYTALLQGTSAGNLFVNVKEKGAADGGVAASGLAFNGVAFTPSSDCPKGTLFFGNKASWKRVELRAAGFDEDFGPMLTRVVDKDAAVGYFKAYYELVCTQPNANSLLTGVLFG